MIDDSEHARIAQNCPDYDSIPWNEDFNSKFLLFKWIEYYKGFFKNWLKMPHPAADFNFFPLYFYQCISITIFKVKIVFIN